MKQQKQIVLINFLDGNKRHVFFDNQPTPLDIIENVAKFEKAEIKEIILLNDRGRSFQKFKASKESLDSQVLDSPKVLSKETILFFLNSSNLNSLKSMSKGSPVKKEMITELLPPRIKYQPKVTSKLSKQAIVSIQAIQIICREITQKHYQQLQRLQKLERQWLIPFSHQLKSRKILTNMVILVSIDVTSEWKDLSRAIEGNIRAPSMIVSQNYKEISKKVLAFLQLLQSLTDFYEMQYQNQAKKKLQYLNADLDKRITGSQDKIRQITTDIESQTNSLIDLSQSALNIFLKETLKRHELEIQLAEANYLEEIAKFEDFFKNNTQQNIIWLKNQQISSKRLFEDAKTLIDQVSDKKYFILSTICESAPKNQKLFELLQAGIQEQLKSLSAEQSKKVLYKIRGIILNYFEVSQNKGMERSKQEGFESQSDLLAHQKKVKSDACGLSNALITKLSEQ